VLALCSCGLLAVWPGASRAQAPAPSPSPPASPPPGVVPAPAPSPSPAVPAERTCDPEGDICITAQTQEQLGRQHRRATGFVDLRFGQTQIQTEQLDLYETPNPDGSVSRRIEAVGNVVFLRGEERLAGDKLTMDLDSGRGTFENALGFMNPDVFVEARRIERVDADTFRIEGGKFTSCSQPRPRWSFSASRATLDVDKRITAFNVLFKVKEVPVLPIPWFTYPIEEDQRSTGILFPQFGRSTSRGRMIRGGFFWAMTRSLDQSFFLDNFSEYGWGYGHEFRYRMRQPSRGDFRTYFIRRTFQLPAPVWEHELDWTAVQVLPGKLRASLRVRESSNIDFRQQFQDDLDNALYRNRSSSASLQRSFGAANVLLVADSTDTFFETDETFTRRRHLPTLETTLSPRKHKPTGLVLSFLAKGENLSLGDQDRVDTYGRYDLFPRLSRPLSLSFLQVTPEVAFRSTWYGVTDLDLDPGEDDFSGPPAQRKYFEGNVAVVGPTFSRVFDTPGNFYSEKYKHVIGPELTWTYRPRLDEFELYPFFDHDDRVLGTNQLAYALVQRFYSKRTGASGKPETYEFLNLRVAQTYYVETGASAFDPSYSSSPFGPEGEPSHYSPIQARLRFRPTPRFTTDARIEYDVNFKQLKSFTFNTSAQYERLRLDLLWNRGLRFGLRRGVGVSQNTFRGSTRLDLLPRRLSVDGRADYDFIEKKMLQSSAGLRYDIQCCGLRVEVIKSNYFVQDTRFNFSISLAHVGSISPLNGLDAGRDRPY
jgi:lipopolysaccharide assembly outer membrane protein LptD (OstA)